MVAHDRVDIDRDGETLGHETDAGLDPILAAPEGATDIRVIPAQEGPPDAALDAVIGVFPIEGDEFGAWTRLEDSAPLLQHRSYRKTSRSLAGNFRIVAVRDISPPR